ncbi:MAG: bifunctional phosphoribosylaminoimidazolecarboxamide formyltransferase/IMP cyclohydrolase, partial [Actinobacteria bacterium]|nr:bifunctional phosphoribosylaminoimidazolecarboxamide formyltransferase/IMP cyclohydrolase [Actinomycetota bacterium]
MPRIRRALVSVSDKADVAWLARELSDMGVEVISTGGTYKLLRNEGINASPAAEVTGFPEMLDGR